MNTRVQSSSRKRTHIAKLSKKILPDAAMYLIHEVTKSAHTISARWQGDSLLKSRLHGANLRTLQRASKITPPTPYLDRVSTDRNSETHSHSKLDLQNPRFETVLYRLASEPMLRDDTHADWHLRGHSEGHSHILHARSIQPLSVSNPYTHPFSSLNIYHLTTLSVSAGLDSSSIRFVAARHCHETFYREPNS